MFNFYSKLTTAFAAFAIIFSFSAHAQCDDVTLTLSDSYGDGGGSVTIDGTTYTLAAGSSEDFAICIDLSICNDVVYAATDSWSYENSWSISDAAGTVLASGADASGQVGTCGGDPEPPASCDLDEATLTLSDSYGDGGGSVTIDGTTYTLAAGSSEDFAICIDLSICNDVVYAATDSWSYENSWSISDAAGTVLASGADASGQVGTCGGDPEPPADCIDVSYTVGGGSYDSEISWAILDADGNVVLEGIAPVSGVECLDIACYTFIGTDSWGDGWNGATASITNNGNEILNFGLAAGESGSAEFCVSNDIEGCTDESASNYNPDATIDDGSCCSGDLVTINLYDSFGDGWAWGDAGNGSFDGGMNFDGVYYAFLEGSSASFDFCLDAGCYEADLLLDNYPGEASWDVVVGGAVIANGSGADLFFSTDPSCIVAGCNDEIACNYDPAANVNDGSCDYVTCAGCTDGGACNYDMDATLEDGSCDYSCVGCMDSTATNYDANATIACEDCCAYCEGAFAGTLNVGGGSWDGEIG